MAKKDMNTAAQTASTTESPFEGFKAKQLNTEIIKVAVGEKFVGRYQGAAQVEVNDPATPGKKKPMTRFLFESPTDGHRIALNGDAGLAQALEGCGVKQGELVGLIKKDKISLKGGRTCNQWDVYQLS